MTGSPIPSRVGLGFLVGVVGLAACAQDQPRLPEAPQQALQLQLIDASPLPRALALMQGDVDASGALRFAWNAREIFDFEPEVGAGPIKVCDGGVQNVMAVGATGHGVVVGGGLEPGLFAVGPDDCPRLASLGIDLMGASVLEDRVAIISGSGGLKLSWVSVDGRSRSEPAELAATELARDVLHAAASDTLPLIVADATDGGVLIASRITPFNWIAVDSVGGAIREEWPLRTLGSQVGEGWLTTSVHRVDGGFLQVIADTRSLRRLLLSYADDASSPRLTELSLPFGVLAVGQAEKVLYAVRRTEELELLKYSWRWSNARLPSDAEGK
jgi:hypothetical protein